MSRLRQVRVDLNIVLNRIDVLLIDSKVGFIKLSRSEKAALKEAKNYTEIAIKSLLVTDGGNK